MNSKLNFDGYTQRISPSPHATHKVKASSQAYILCNSLQAKPIWLKFNHKKIKHNFVFIYLFFLLFSHIFTLTFMPVFSTNLVKSKKWGVQTRGAFETKLLESMISQWFVKWSSWPFQRFEIVKLKQMTSRNFFLFSLSKLS